MLRDVEKIDASPWRDMDAQPSRLLHIVLERELSLSVCHSQ